jgi:hypothetical protein
MLAMGFTIAVIALSMTMNGLFGYSLGTTELNARIFAALSVAGDGLKSLLPLFIDRQLADHNRRAAIAGGLMFLLLLAYAIASAVGFAAQNRGDLAASRDNLPATLLAASAGLKAAEARHTALSAHRLAGEIEAELAGLRKDRLWDASAECAGATSAASRAFCKKIEALRAELAVAAEDKALTAEIRQFRFEIKRAREAGAGRHSDLQAAAFRWVTGLDDASIRLGLAWLLGLAVEAISCFGLFAVLRRHPPDGPDTARPWRLVRKHTETQAIAGVRGKRLPAISGISDSGEHRSHG